MQDFIFFIKICIYFLIVFCFENTKLISKATKIKPKTELMMKNFY